jgi:hypothetical protein
MNETFIVRYTGNSKGHLQTEKWMGSIFEVYERGPSFQVLCILLNNKGFTPEKASDISFYKYNARELGPDEVKKYKFINRLGEENMIEKELFEI